MDVSPQAIVTMAVDGGGYNIEWSFVKICPSRFRDLQNGAHQIKTKTFSLKAIIHSISRFIWLEVQQVGMTSHEFEDAGTTGLHSPMDSTQPPPPLTADSTP